MMTFSVLELVFSAVGVLLALVAAGIFIRRGTTVTGIDVMDKVIAAYGVAEKLEERKYAALLEQKAATELERDALSVQLSAAKVRVSNLENATSSWVLERTELINNIAILKKQVVDQEIRITQLETMLANANIPPNP